MLLFLRVTGIFLGYMDPLNLRKLAPMKFSGSVAPSIMFLRTFYVSLKLLLVSIGICDKKVYMRSNIRWSPIFPFNAVASCLNPRALRCWVALVSGILIMGMLWIFFNGEGRYGHVLCLMDICCDNFVLEPHSVEKYQQYSERRRELVLTWRQ